MAQAIDRTGTAQAVGEAYATGGDLLADLMARPARLGTMAEVEAPAPESGLFTALLAKPLTARFGDREDEATLAPPVPMPQAIATPGAPVASKGGRVLRRRTEAADPTAHGAFDELLAASIAAMPVNRRLGRCKVCGQVKGVCGIGPFWGDA